MLSLQTCSSRPPRPVGFCRRQCFRGRHVAASSPNAELESSARDCLKYVLMAFTNRRLDKVLQVLPPSEVNKARASMAASRYVVVGAFGAAFVSHACWCADVLVLSHACMLPAGVYALDLESSLNQSNGAFTDTELHSVPSAQPIMLCWLHDVTRLGCVHTCSDRHHLH